MPDKFCPHCGTEVDEDARFCPTCGQTLEPDGSASADADDQPTIEVRREGTGEDAIPPAPAWPPAPEPQHEPEPEADPEPEDEPDAEPEPETELEREPEPRGEDPGTEAPRAAAAPPPPPAGPPATRPGDDGRDLPFSVPTTLSGWLIGAGSGFAALALLPLLGNILNLLLFLALLWITATVFLADRMPAFAHQRLATLAVVMVALGVALDRAAFTVRGVDTIFLITILVAAGGVLILELGRDRPVPPPAGLR